MINLKSKPIVALSSNEIHRMYEIANHYYQDPVNTIKLAIQRASHIYIVCKENKIISFFLVSWERLMLADNVRPSLYLGLSMVDKEYRSHKCTTVAYSQCSIDIDTWQKENNLKLIIWCITATPVVIKVVKKFWKLISPIDDNLATKEVISIANSIQKYYYLQSYIEINPFVLKRSSVVRFTKQEKLFLLEIEKKNNITIFEELGIVEENGDRLLMIFESVNKYELETLKNIQKDLINDEYP